MNLRRVPVVAHSVPFGGDAEKLAMIERAEDALIAWLPRLPVATTGGGPRRTWADEMARALDRDRDAIVRGLKAIGYRYITSICRAKDGKPHEGVRLEPV